MRTRLKLNLPLLILLAQVSPTGAGAAVDYVREVKPILADHCYRCHGASQQKGGLRLDTAVFALKGGDLGPALKPGRAAESLLIQLVKGEHPDLARMPYKKSPLSDAQIATLAQWINEGTNAPADEQPEKNKHWAFVAPVRPPVPVISKSAISDLSKTRAPAGALKTDSLITDDSNPIDAFILARLERDRIQPSPEADRVTLIRRLSLDLLGLPPTPAEVDDFVNDRRPDTYERLVDRLLASPHYGERWGRHWLDVARYADSNGYSIDAPRSIWKYRDWVVAALNRDLPFDQFVLWQLAGDLIATNNLEPGTRNIEPLIATGFHRNTQINQEGGIDPEQFRVESVMDRVNTTATAFLGVTLACAQCHDHKFDPFTQREYYQFYAFFNNTIEDGHGKAAPEGMLEIPGEAEAAENVQKELVEAEGELGRYLDTKGSDALKWEQSLSPEARAKLKPAVRKSLELPWDKRDLAQKRAAYAVFRVDDPEFKSRNTKLTKLEKREPKPVTTLVMVERKEPRESVVFIKGDFTRRGASVMPGVPAILPALPPGKQTNRLALAQWIVATNNPLTARVMVNRVWQQYFGRGLVETENDFGTQGTPPSHPELLDWLACELMQPSGSIASPSPGGEGRGEGGKNQARSANQPRTWSLKHLHRLIVTSATYRQSSRARPELALVDPNNKLLARQSRLRLDAEAVRDVCLRASGLLNEKLGGPPVFPPQPNGVMTLGQSRRDWKPSPGTDRYRRGLYTHFWRATPHPALMVFDAADGFSACTRRLRSNTPLQALTLLNDEAFYECAQSLASRALRDGPKSDSARLDFMFQLCLARRPSPDERQRLHELLSRQLASTTAGSKPTESWTTLARVLLNLDETITRE